MLAGVETGVLGEVGVAGFVVLPALYMGVLCLYWPGKVEVALAPAVADSSGWRADGSAEPPALALKTLNRHSTVVLPEQSVSCLHLFGPFFVTIEDRHPTWLCLRAGNVRGGRNHARCGW